MLIAVCIAAICLHLPVTIMYPINRRKSNLWPSMDFNSVTSGRIYGAMLMCEVVATSNHAINFFLYCVSGSAFRRQVRRAFVGSGSSSGAEMSVKPTAV